MHGVTDAVFTPRRRRLVAVEVRAVDGVRAWSAVWLTGIRRALPVRTGAQADRVPVGVKHVVDVDRDLTPIVGDRGGDALRGVPKLHAHKGVVVAVAVAVDRHRGIAG